MGRDYSRAVEIIYDVLPLKEGETRGLDIYGVCERFTSYCWESGIEHPLMKNGGGSHGGVKAVLDGMCRDGFALRERKSKEQALEDGNRWFMNRFRYFKTPRYPPRGKREKIRDFQRASISDILPRPAIG